MSTQITEVLEQGALETAVRGLPGPAGTPGEAGASGPPGVGNIDLRDEGYLVDVPGVESDDVPPTLSDAATNMAALNASVETLRANANGESTIHVPAGVGRIQPVGGVGWRFQNLGGFTISAGGANLGQGNTPDDSSWHNVNNAADNFFVGSELFAIGFGAAAVIDLFDVSSVRIEGLTIRGDGADPAAIGIRIGKLVGGLGPSTIHGSQGKIHNCDVGIDVGVVGVTGGGFVNANCSEIHLEQWAFSRCGVAYLVHHNQALNHFLAQPQFSEVGHCVWQLDGGSIVIDQPVLYDCERLITVSQGGSATGVIQVRGARVDGNTHRTKLFHADLDGELVFASFLGGTTSGGNRDAGNEARCTVGSAHFVYVCDWINLVRTDATGPAFEFTGAGRKGVILERCRLPSSSPHFPDVKKIIGNVDATGWWGIYDSHADGTLGGSHEGKRLANVEYPRINEGASTHRLHIFDHCTSPGLQGMTAGASGAAASVTRVAGGKQHPGTRRMQTGSTATGYAYIATEIDAFLLGGGDWRTEVCARLPALSTSGQRFTARIGFMNSQTAAPTNGVFFEYRDDLPVGEPGQWRCKVVVGGVTTLDHETGFDADTNWHVFQVRPSADGTSVDFMIDNTVVYSGPTAVPSAGGQDVGFTTHIVKSIGTTAASLDVDFYDLKNFPSVPGGTAYPK